LPWDLLRCKVFFSDIKDVMQSNKFSATLASMGACRFTGEYRDETKATAKLSDQLVVRRADPEAM